jgi:hypothetical protein
MITATFPKGKIFSAPRLQRGIASSNASVPSPGSSECSVFLTHRTIPLAHQSQFCSAGCSEIFDGGLLNARRLLGGHITSRHIDGKPDPVRRWSMPPTVSDPATSQSPTVCPTCHHLDGIGAARHDRNRRPPIAAPGRRRSKRIHACAHAYQ